MDFSVLSKDIARLPCPCCGEEVALRTTLNDMRNRRRGKLSCPHCQAPLRWVARFYGSAFALVVTMLPGTWISLPSPWEGLISVGGAILTLWLLALEINSAHLEACQDSCSANSQDGSTPQAHP